MHPCSPPINAPGTATDPKLYEADAAPEGPDQLKELASEVRTDGKVAETRLLLLAMYSNALIIDRQSMPWTVVLVVYKW
jgi:hypothetical protein